MWWFENWSDLLRVVIVGTTAYASLVLLLRVTGKRTLSKLNAFDFLVTVALGSTLATILLSKEVSFAEGMTALTLLVFLQYAVTWISVRSPGFQRIIKAEPTLVVRDGQPLSSALRDQRVTIEELLASVRMAGLSRIEDAAAVVLETDGSLTVLDKTQAPAGTLRPVSGTSLKS